MNLDRRLALIAIVSPIVVAVLNRVFPPKVIVEPRRRPPKTIDLHVNFKGGLRGELSLAPVIAKPKGPLIVTADLGRPHGSSRA